MSFDKYTKKDAFECNICGERYDHPSLASRCWRGCKLREVAYEIAELRIRGGIGRSDVEHPHNEVSKMIELFEEQRDVLEEQFGDDCDHMEAMKEVDPYEGGVYCVECQEKVNEHPKDPQTITISPPSDEDN